MHLDVRKGNEDVKAVRIVFTSLSLVLLSSLGKTQCAGILLVLMGCRVHCKVGWRWLMCVF